MKIAKGVEMLELKIDSPQGVVTLNPILIWDESSAILIDTGMPGQWGQIQSGMEMAGVPLEKLKGVIITHQDLDHVGSITEILEEKPDIMVYAHKLDQPYIEGERPLIKTDTSKLSKEVLDSIPKEIRAIYENPPKAKVNHMLSDGEELPFCGGIEVIFTPGHTPGHISLYLKDSKTLVAADAMVYHEGKLRGPIAQATLDMETATQSLKKFLDYDIDQVVCYHGGLCSDNIKAQINRIV
jgi:glyoxylase-like metal-dependent hydrolase (beta-lactamase superfamily II)